MSYEYYRYCANPPINFFPRALKDLFKEEKITVDGVETTEKKCELKDILSTYEDGDSYTLAGEKFKKIENRIYLDLGKINESSNEYTVTKKVCVGFLAKHDDTYDFMKAETKYYSLLLKCETDNNAFSSYLVYEDQNNSKDPSKPISINLNNSPYKIKELSIVVKYSATNIPDNAKLKIYATYCNISGWSHTFTLDIYRNTENSLDGFKQSSGKDTDFFVLPRVNPSNNQKNCIKQLQIINNQVFARNKKINTNSFKFVKEEGLIKKDGTFDFVEYKNLKDNISNSITAFKTDKNDEEAGCRSDRTIKGSENDGIVVSYPYNFENYGQDEQLISYLCNNYNLTSELRGIVLDRNFLFGFYKEGDSDDKIEGIVNLYRKVVIPFQNQIVSQYNEYLNFNTRWLTCPKYNAKYQRGDFTIVNSVKLYTSKTGVSEYNLNSIPSYTGTNNTLPINTIVSFKQGRDLYAFDEDISHFYEITSLQFPNEAPVSISAWIKLSFNDKASIDDRIDTNFSNYMGSQENELSNYSNNGIPYYMNGMDSKNIKGSRKLKTDELMSWNEDKKNWYLYNAKPNTGDFGIDCSGLISNCISAFVYENNKSHFVNKNDYFQKNINAVAYEQLSVKMTNFDVKQSLGRADILVSSEHIVFVSEDNISKDTYEKREVIVTHNYFGFNSSAAANNETTSPSITLLNNSSFSDGVFCKTVQGYYRHAGVSFNRTSARRLYLWY